MSIQKKQDAEKLDSLLSDLKPLLKNIQKAVTSYGVKGFNSQLNSLLVKEDELDRHIEIVVDQVCKEFNISRRVLLRNPAAGIVKEPKYTCACILHFELKLTIRMIARYVFKNKQFGFVALATSRHKKLNVEKVKPDKEYKERYDKLIKIIKELTENKTNG